VIGADGAETAYVFRRRADGTWEQKAKIIRSVGTGNDHYGTQISLDGNTALIGAWGFDMTSFEEDEGTAYFYEFTDFDFDGVLDECERAKIRKVNLPF